MRKSIILVIGLLLLIQTVTASNMVFTKSSTSEPTTIGVTVDDDYYTAIVKDSKLQKLELNGNETTEYQIKTTKQELADFMQKQAGMNRLEKIKYIITNFKVSLPLMMRVAGDYIKGVFS